MTSSYASREYAYQTRNLETEPEAAGPGGQDVGQATDLAGLRSRRGQAIADYSPRKTAISSTRVACRAGMIVAASAGRARSTAATAKLNTHRRSRWCSGTRDQPISVGSFVMGYSGRVLVIEDDSVLRRSRAARLRQHGLDVITAADGDEGIRIAKTPPLVDVIVVDLLATPQRGLDVMSALGADPSTAGIPVLLLSDSMPEETRRPAPRLPSDDIVRHNQLAEQVGRLVQPVDTERFRDFFDGTGETFQGVAQLFLADYDDKVPELADAADRRTAVAIEQLAHRVRGTASANGADRLADILLEMERLAREGQAGAAAAIMPSVERELRSVRLFLCTSPAAMDGR